MTKQETINWEQRRYELAKEIFITFLAKTETKIPCNYISVAIEFADAIIEDLKKY